jgi:hypothetical protein
VSPVELTDGIGGGEVVVESYDSEKAWLSITHSILSVSNTYIIFSKLPSRKEGNLKQKR